MPIHRHPITSTEQKSARLLKDIPLDKMLIERLKSTYRKARQGDDRSLAKIFYGKLFSAHPELRNIFPADLEQQASTLIAMLDQVVNNLEYPEENAQRLLDLGRRHRDCGVQPAHYSIVVNLLTESMRELLGSMASDQAIEEWRMMLALISQQMIDS